MKRIGNMEVPDDTEHLGDGAYAWFDGWNICIAAERENGTHWVALEPEVLAALNRFANKHYGTGAKHSLPTTHAAKLARAAERLAADLHCSTPEGATIIDAALRKLNDEERARLAAEVEADREAWDERDQT